ncbi:MAG: trimeric autotransporter adhesin, partial [Bacteroidota bacterium]|nr:trimeric autotransporter adhesin [Bacteroidota bacterium]
MKKAVLIIVLCLLSLTFTNSAKAQFFTTPDTTFFQGFLTDGDGAPLDRRVQASVVLYADGSRVSAVFTGLIDVVKGYFSIPITLDTNPMGDFLYKGKNLAIEIEVDGKVFSPRINIGSVPNAKAAQTADSALRIMEGSVSDVKVAGNAAIQGTKIIPDFGSQNIQTSGSLVAGSAGFDTLVVLKYFYNIGLSNFQNAIYNNIPNTGDPIYIADSLLVSSGLLVGGEGNFAKSIQVALNANIHGNAFIDSSARISGDLNIQSRIFNGVPNAGAGIDIADAANVQNNLTVGGDETVTGNISVKKSANISGEANIDSNARVAGNLNVMKGIYNTNIGAAPPVLINDGLQIQNNLTVGGSSTFSRSVEISSGNFTARGNAFFDQGVTVNGKLNANDSAFFNNSVNISRGGLDVRGNSAFHNRAAFDSAVNFGSGINVKGKSVLSDSLIVLGPVKFSQVSSGDLIIGDPLADLIVRGNIYGNKQLILADNAENMTVPERLWVDGTGYMNDAEIGNNININGAAFVRDSFMLQGKAAITGNLGVGGASDMKGTLAVAGKSTFNNEIESTGKTTIKNNAVIYDTLTARVGQLTGNLSVAGSGIFSGSLTGTYIGASSLLTAPRIVISGGAADGTQADLGANAIQGSEIESVNNANKIKTGNMYKAADVKDNTAMLAANINLKNVSTAVLKYLRNNPNGMYDGEDILGRDADVGIGVNDKLRTVQNDIDYLIQNSINQGQAQYILRQVGINAGYDGTRVSMTTVNPSGNFWFGNQ